MLRAVTSKVFQPENGLLLHLADPRPISTRIQDLLKSREKEELSRTLRKDNPFQGKLTKVFSVLSNKTYRYQEDLPCLTSTSKKLVVLLHGLNSSPLAWSGYLKEVWQDPDTASFIPFIRNKGYCKVEDAAQPILEVVQAYANKNPESSIILVGHSNGARIGGYVERNLQASNVRLVSIAGPHGGSRLMSCIHLLGMEKKFGLTQEVTQQFTYLGPWATQELLKWQAKEGPHERIFLATADDLRVFPTQTSFPNLPNSTYHLVSQESHVTVIDGVKPFILPYIIGSS